MRKLVVLVCLLTVVFLQAQGVKPKFEAVDDLVKVTYYHDNGSVKQQGFFYDMKLTGTWTTYDKRGAKTAIAKYRNGKKVGKWFVLSTDGLKEITYKNNKVLSVENWKGATSLAQK